MRKYALAGTKARRKAGYITIWRRIKSDAFFVASQKMEILLAVISFSLTILTVQMYMVETRDDQLEVTAAALILLTLFGAVLSFIALAHEQGCNEKAVFVRSLIERRRNKPPRRARARKVNQPSAGASLHSPASPVGSEGSAGT